MTNSPPTKPAQKSGQKIPQKTTKKTPQKMVKKDPKKGGRPSKFSEDCVRKLEEAFRCAGSVEDACAYAGISRETYYDWCDPNRRFSDSFTPSQQEEFLIRMQAARVYPKLGCKRTLVQAGIKGDWRAAVEYLKRVDPEYKDKVDTTLASYSFNGIEIINVTQG